MSTVTASVDGISQIRIAVKKLGGAVLQQAINRALYSEAHFVVSEAIPITPVDTGNLRNSFTVDAPVSDGDQTTVTIRNVSEYALYVHESPKKYKVGDYKYLTRALERRSVGMVDRLHAAIGAHLDAEIAKGGNS